MNSPISWCSPRTSEKFQALNDSEGKETLASQPAYRINLPVTSSQPPICQIFSPTARFLSTWTSRNANVSLFVGTSKLLFCWPPRYPPHIFGDGNPRNFLIKKKNWRSFPFPMPFTSRFSWGKRQRHQSTAPPELRFGRFTEGDQFPTALVIFSDKDGVRHARSPGRCVFWGMDGSCWHINLSYPENLKPQQWSFTPLIPAKIGTFLHLPYEFASMNPPH